MNNKNKTKEQLIKELEEMRQRITKLEASETQHKKTEEKLKESGRRYRDLINYSNGIVSRVDGSGNWTFLSPSVKRILGYEPAEMVGKSAFDFMLPEDIASTREAHERVVRKGKRFWEYENRWIRKDGRIITLAWNVVALRDEQGKIIGTQGLGRDITDRKRAEKELKESTSHFETLFNVIVDPVVIVDAKGKILEITNRVQEVTGFNREELVGKSFLKINLLTAKSKAIAIKNLAKRIMGMKIAPYELEVLTKDGKKISFEINAARIDYRGKPANMVVFRDLTERKKAEERIRQQNAFLGNTLESLTYPFYVIDVKDYTIKMANSATRLGKISKDSTCYALIHKNSQPCKRPKHGCPLEEVRKTKKPTLVEHIHFDKDGNVRNVEVHGYPIFDDSGNLIQMIEYCLDITERKKAGEELRKSEERFRTSVENMLDCFAIYSAVRDESGRIVDFLVEYVNAAACANNRMTKEEQIGKRLLELLPAHRETGLFDEYCQVVETGKPLVKESIVYEDVYKKERLRRTFDTRAAKLGDGFAAAWRDITEQKKAEQRIEALSRFPSESPNPVLRIATDGKVLYANDAGKEIFKARVGKKMPERYLPALKKSIASKQYVSLEEQVGNRYFSSVIRSIPKASYCNMYGRDITERKKAEKKIEAYGKRLRSLASELTLIEERERRNLASELHESISQLLALCRIKLGKLEKVTELPDARLLVKEVEEHLEEVIWHTRFLTLRLGPPVLYEFGLESALEWLAEHMQEQYGIDTKLKVDAEADPRDEELRIFLFRAVQELMTNIAKHTGTDKAKVSVLRVNDTVRVSVEDRGVGFDPTILEALSHKDKGFGLFSIGERIKYFGGKLSIQSKPGEGTQVILTVPLKALPGKK